MKKILGVGILSLTLLAGCGLNKASETPEQVIKTLQTNVIKQFKQTPFAIQKGEGVGSLKVDATTPVGSGYVNVDFTSKGDDKIGSANLKINGQLNTLLPQAINAKLTADMDFVGGLKKLYLRLNSLNIESTDPKLLMMNAFAKNINGKWFFMEKPSNDSVDSIIQKINLEDKFAKYSIFKVNKKLGDYKYEVSLNQDNIAKIAYEIEKEANPNSTGLSLEKIRKEMGSGDIVGVLKVEEDKTHFSFSGSVVDGKTKNIVVVKYLENQLYLNASNAIIVDLAKKGDTYKGATTISSEEKEFKLNTELKIDTNDVYLKLVFDENVNGAKVVANILFNMNVKKKDNIKIDIPKDALPIQSLSTMVGGNK